MCKTYKTSGKAWSIMPSFSFPENVCPSFLTGSLYTNGLWGEIFFPWKSTNNYYLFFFHFLKGFFLIFSTLFFMLLVLSSTALIPLLPPAQVHTRNLLLCAYFVKFITKTAFYCNKSFPSNGIFLALKEFICFLALGLQVLSIVS